MKSLFVICILVQWVLFLARNTQGLFTKPKPKGDCSEDITEPVAWLRTPNFPDKYPRYSRCVWKIVKSSPDICTVQLTLLTFKVTRMTFTGCDEDYLEIDDGIDKKRLCGDLQRGTLKVVSFPASSNFVTLTFRSTFHEDGGFEIRVKQLRGACGLSTTKSTQGPPTSPAPCIRNSVGRLSRIVSPDQKGGCTYTIWRSSPRACRLQMDLLEFDVPNVEGCPEEYVQLPGGQRLCGNLGGTRKFMEFEEGEDEKLVISKGDRNVFNIQITQLPGPCAYANVTQATGTNSTERPEETTLLTTESPGTTT